DDPPQWRPDTTGKPYHRDDLPDARRFRGRRDLERIAHRLQGNGAGTGQPADRYSGEDRGWFLPDRARRRAGGDRGQYDAAAPPELGRHTDRLPVGPPRAAVA